MQGQGHACWESHMRNSLQSTVNRSSAKAVVTSWNHMQSPDELNIIERIGIQAAVKLTENRPEKKTEHSVRKAVLAQCIGTSCTNHSSCSSSGKTHVSNTIKITNKASSETKITCTLGLLKMLYAGSSKRSLLKPPTGRWTKRTTNPGTESFC